MAIQDGRALLMLGAIFFTGVLFQFLGCALWHNWWPMLTALMYVLVPMPYLFFGGGGDSFGSSSGGWQDAGKFLTGFSAVGSIAIPAILAHAQIIATGALVMELAAAFILGTGVLLYDYFSSREGYYY